MNTDYFNKLKSNGEIGYAFGGPRKKKTGNLLEIRWYWPNAVAALLKLGENTKTKSATAQEVWIKNCPQRKHSCSELKIAESPLGVLEKDLNSEWYESWASTCSCAMECSEKSAIPKVRTIRKNQDICTFNRRNCMATKVLIQFEIHYAMNAYLGNEKVFSSL